MARKFDPLHTRWKNLAESIRNAKGNMDFGDIDPSKTADEQRDDNEVAVAVEEMITDLRGLASELGSYFDIYVQDTINNGVEEALKDSDSFQKMVALLIKEGKLDGALLQQSTADTEEDDEEYDADMAELEAEIAEEEALLKEEAELEDAEGDAQGSSEYTGY